MGEIFTPQELEQFFALASEANELGVRASQEYPAIVFISINAKSKGSLICTKRQ